MTDKNWQRLTPEEVDILIHKGTEPPFSGEYCDASANGVYECRQCQAPLYTSRDKFHSGCGWPSFDDEIKNAITRQPDIDGRRTEIICANCQGHLGHVFSGERHTPKNLRHCVNSLSMKFMPIEALFSLAKSHHSIYGAALFAAGCFWGVEQKFSEQPGVLAVAVGYTGGTALNPSYEQVCQGNTGHAEAVQIIYHRKQTDYNKLVEFFFSMHDATQLNRQGVDVGSQYRSAIFYLDDEQKKIADQEKQRLQVSKIPVVTEITQAEKFWPAEEYHQQYYIKHPNSRFSCG